MKYEDDDLKKLLNPLKEQKPDELMMKRWQGAVQSELKQSKTNKITFTKWTWAAQLVAATIVGVVIGVALLKNHPAQEFKEVQVAQNSIQDATFEHSHANLD